MTLTTLYPQGLAALKLNSGPTWNSFDQFRKGGVQTLAPLSSGVVGTLRTGNAQYKILLDSDFQVLLGLATEVDRLKKGMRVVLSAAKVVERHHDDLSIESLMAAVSMIIDGPELPTRNGWDSSELADPEIEMDSDDEVELENLERPLSNAV